MCVWAYVRDTWLLFLNKKFKAFIVHKKISMYQGLCLGKQILRVYILRARLIWFWVYARGWSLIISKKKICKHGRIWKHKVIMNKKATENDSNLAFFDRLKNIYAWKKLHPWIRLRIWQTQKNSFREFLFVVWTYPWCSQESHHNQVQPYTHIKRLIFLSS